MKHPKGMCEVCGTRTASYGMYRTREGVKEWVKVCVGCEEKIGTENMRRWFENSLINTVKGGT